AASTVATAHPGGRSGTITFDAGQIALTGNKVLLEGYSKGVLAASERILVSGGGSFEAAGDLSLQSPGITGESVSKYWISAAGLLETKRQAGPGSTVAAAGFGADLTLEGARVR